MIFISIGRWLVMGAAAALVACSSTPERPKPAPLASGVNVFGIQQVWRTSVGATPAALAIWVGGSRMAFASSDGHVTLVDGGNGALLWRSAVGAPVAAGVGGDGRRLAVVTAQNDVLALDAANGRVLWRKRLPAQVFTVPLVAGERVFVLAADRSVTAFDGASGDILWTQQRAGDALVLQRGGVLLAVDDTLVAGLGGRLVGMNPGNGQARWEAPIATPRGITDVERLVDLLAAVSRVGPSICVRAFQTAIGCVDAARGLVQWTRPANGAQGLSGDAERLFGTEADGTLLAWRRTDGERAWTSERFKHRQLSAPALLGRTLAIGDQEGQLLLVSREDGGLLARMPTDGSAITAQPVLAGNTLVVVTRNGSVVGFRPE